jgi:hypothetical protein
VARSYGRTLRRRTVAVAIAFAMVAMVALVAVGYVIRSPRRTVVVRPIAAARTTTSTTSHVGCFKVDPVHPRLIPKPGFDPLTASAAELQAQDFPPRPTNPDQLSIWQEYANKYLAGQIINCADPGPGDIPPRYRTLAHAISVPIRP